MTWFNPHIIRYLSDEASKKRGKHLFEKLGFINIDYKETRRSGQDLTCDASDNLLAGLEIFKPVSSGRYNFELTMRFSLHSFYDISWFGRKSYNVMERRLKNNHGKVERFSGLVDFAWAAKESAESFYYRMFTKEEQRLNDGLGPKYEDLAQDDERKTMIDVLIDEDFQKWLDDETGKAVFFTYEDIVNPANIIDKTLTASVTGSHSLVYQVPASKRIRISLSAGVFRIKLN